MNPQVTELVHKSSARIIVGILLTMTAAPAMSTTIDVEPGTPNQLNGWPASTVSMHWQQGYASSYFGSSPLIIDSFSFLAGSNSSVSYGADFTVTMSTTTSAPGSLSTTFASNVGGDVQTVLSGPLTITATQGDFSMFALTSPFYYDPTQGHLLIEIVHDVALSGVGTVEFEAYDPTPSGLIQRIAIANSTATTGVDAGFGELVTRFQVHNVPEPSTIALAAFGFVGLMAWGWQRWKR